MRRVTPDGIIHTFAGSCQSAGFSGDGGQATAALLNGPEDIAFGPDGSLYIADSTNNGFDGSIRPAIIQTVAGSGPTDRQLRGRTSAEMADPRFRPCSSSQPASTSPRMERSTSPILITRASGGCRRAASSRRWQATARERRGRHQRRPRDRIRVERTRKGPAGAGRELLHRRVRGQRSPPRGHGRNHPSVRRQRRHPGTPGTADLRRPQVDCVHRWTPRSDRMAASTYSTRIIRSAESTRRVSSAQ